MAGPRIHLSVAAPQVHPIMMLGEAQGYLKALEASPAASHQEMGSSIAKTFACYRGHLGPSGPKLEKESENEFPGPLGPGAQKVENGVEKESKSTLFQLF